MQSVSSNLVLFADRRIHVGKYHCRHSNADSVPTQGLASAKHFAEANMPLPTYNCASPEPKFVVVKGPAGYTGWEVRGE